MALIREILFRGQTRKYGEKVVMGTGEKLPGQWVYGGIFPGTGDFSVIYGWETGEEQTGSNIKKWTVYSDTVGQYTGLTDKNGVKIFEGDIVREHLKGLEEAFNRVCLDYGKVFWHQKTSRFLRTATIFFDVCPEMTEFREHEVVGNIYDNPELLERTREGNHHERRVPENLPREHQEARC